MQRLSWLAGLALLTLLIAPAAPAQDSEGPTEGLLPAEWVDSLDWRSIGPANMSGRITALAVYEADPCIWWAASASGGLLKTTNNGVTFEHQFDHQAVVSIGDVQVAQSNPEIVWVGTGESNPRNSVSWGNGVYKSTDGGTTWQHMGLDESFQIGRIAIHPENPDIVYVGALGRLWGPNEQRGLFKTTDGGENWEKVLFVNDQTGVIDVQMHPQDPDTLLVATYERQRDGFDSNDPAKKNGPGSGVYKTTDGGETFEEITEGLPTGNLGRIGISYFRGDPNYVYLVLESEKTGQEPENAPYAGVSGEDAEVGARITQVVEDGPAAAAGLQAGDIIVSMDDEILHSYDDFVRAMRRHVAEESATLQVAREGETLEMEITFGKRPEPEEEEDDPRARFRRRSRSPFDGGLGGQRENMQDQQGPEGHEYGGIYVSEDGGNTFSRINSLNPRPMYYSQIRVDPQDRNHIWVLGTSLYKSEDGGETFRSNGASRNVHVDHHSMWVDPNDGRHVLLGNDGGIYVTWDRGENWDHHNHIAIGQFYHVGVGPRRNYRVYGGLQDNGSWGGPSRSTDGSGAVNSDWFRVGGGDGFICLVDPNDPDLIYFESQNGAMGRINLRTGDRGFIRPQPQRGVSYRWNWKTPFVLSPRNPKIHYSAGNFVFRSLWEGNSVRPISPEITLTDRGSGSALAVSPAEEGVIYVGTTDGALWMTRGEDKDWVRLYPPEGWEDPAASEEADEESADEENQDPPAPAQPPAGQRGRGGARFVEMLKEQDANGDGKIQKDEMPERLSSLFDRLDGNSDGVLDEEELAAVASRGPRGGGGAEGGRPQRPQRDREQAEEASQEETAEEGEAAQEEAAQEETAQEGSGEEESAPGVDPVTGTWEGLFQSENLPAERAGFELVLRLGAENKVTGSFESSMSAGDLEGTYDPESNRVALSVTTDRAELEILGQLSEEKLTGSVDINQGSFSIDFQAERTGPAPSEETDEEAAEDSGTGQTLADFLPGPRWVSSITASRFEAGRAYVTFDGHRSNDDEPYVFATEDYGQSWRSLRANLPTSAGSTRVVREDIENPNLLYLGCEFGIWVSLDRGESWTRLNGNLPTVSVHEVAIHSSAGEIVAGTHGRSLWVLDVAPLRQMTAETISADVHLYKPHSAVKWRSSPSRGASGTRRFVGENPPSGASIYYSLGSSAQEASLTISDVAGTTLRELEAPTDAGLHRVSWDLRQVTQRQGGSGGRGGGGFRGRGGASAVPAGQYLVTLTIDGTEYHETITVENDPDAPDAGPEAMESWDSFLEQLQDEVGDDEEAPSEEDYSRIE